MFDIIDARCNREVQNYTLIFCSVLCGHVVFSCLVTIVWDEPSASVFRVEVNMASVFCSVAAPPRRLSPWRQCNSAFQHLITKLSGTKVIVLRVKLR